MAVAVSRRGEPLVREVQGPQRLPLPHITGNAVLEGPYEPADLAPAGVPGARLRSFIKSRRVRWGACNGSPRTRNGS